MAEKLSIEEVGKYKVNTVLLGGIINIGDQASVIYGNMLDNILRYQHNHIIITDPSFLIQWKTLTGLGLLIKEEEILDSSSEEEEEEGKSE